MSEDLSYLYKDKCVEVLHSTLVSDLPKLNVVEIDSSVGLYEGFQVFKLSLSPN
jgi:hypothetical protein